MYHIMCDKVKHKTIWRQEASSLRMFEARLVPEAILDVLGCD